MGNNIILELKNRTLGYSKENLILKNVNLKIYKNDFLGIIGPNGGGKSTLIKSILKLLPYTTGEEFFYKKNQSQSSINIGYLPQINQLDKQFPISVLDTILSGIKTTKHFFFRYSKSEKEKALELATTMGIENIIYKPIGKLSGGQLQRVLLARAVIDNPDLLILDEPNTYVDKKFEQFFYEFLKKINNRTAIIMVSHDVGTVLTLVKNIACVNQSVHYHSGNVVSNEWLNQTFNCPIDIITHGEVPHRVLAKHDNCQCCDNED